MISGVVNKNLDPIVRLRVIGSNGRDELVDFVVDTGFTGVLSVPTAVVKRLQLSWSHRAEAVLADGSVCQHDVFEGAIEWNGKVIRVPFDAADSDALVGMTMMENHRLALDVIPGGGISIEPLP